MNKATNTATQKKKKAAKPLRRAERWGAQVPRIAAKLVGLVIAISLLGLIFSALQGVGAAWLRIALSAVILIGVLLVCANEGINKGVQDAAASRSYASLAAKGAPLNAGDDAACYHPLKAVCAALLAFAVPMALAVIAALTTQEYTYTLQDLPLWLTDAYGSRSDVLSPLGAYTVQTGMQATDWIRLVVRLPEMIFINFFFDPQRMNAVIDRLSPLFIASYPVMFVLGYLLGPRINRRQQKQNRKAKKIAVRKAERSSLVEELTGAQGQVHYGHQKEEHKKKELI